ncbi:MAG: MFS transporter [Chlamydiota bacterium]|jgi:MFS family permease
MKRNLKLTKASIYFTFFADNLGWSIVFPIFAPYFIDPQNKIFSPEVPGEIRTAILGLFLMAFPLAQFFGSPLIGEYADKTGRRKALVVTIFFTLVGLILSGISLSQNMLILLFVSRLITGAFSGNLSICLAAIADISDSEHHKVKNFGYLSIVAGISFIVGAYIGGKFSDQELNPNFSFSLPLWIASFFTFINLMFVYWGFSETGKIYKNVKFNLLEGVRNIQTALKIKKIKTIYLIYFLILFAWTLIFQFTPVYLIDLFKFSNSQIGNVAAYMGICWAIGSGVISKLPIQIKTRLRFLEFSLVSFSGLCILITLPQTAFNFLLLLGLCVVFAGVTWPLCTYLISSRADKSIQGKILGISQSMQSLAMATSPLVGGLTDFFHLKLFFWISSFACLLAGIIYFKVKV